MKIFRFCFVILLSFKSLAQFNYQALIKDANGTPVSSSEISLRINILDSQAQSVYSEVHSPTTTVEGIVTLIIGEGVSISGNFENINWSYIHYLKDEVDLGDGFIVMGTSRIFGVPIAEYSKSTSSLTANTTISRQGILQSINAILDDLYARIDSLTSGTTSSTADGGGSSGAIVTVSTSNGSDVICEGNDAKISATFYPGATYTWYLGATNLGTTSTSTNTIAAGLLTGLVTSTIGVSIDIDGQTTTSSFTLFINRVDAGTISGTQTICPGNIPAPLTSIRAATSSLTGKLPGSISYQWQQSSDGGISYTTILGATNSSLSLSSPLTSTTRYRRVAISSFNGMICEEFSTPAITVAVSNNTILPTLITNGSYSATVTNCQGDALTFTAGGGQSYEFRVGGTVLYRTNANGLGNATFDSQTDVIAGSAGYTLVNNDRVDVVVYDRPLTGSGTVDPAACSAVSSATRVRTQAPPVLAISTTDATNVVCTDLAAEVEVTAVAGATYTWSVNAYPLQTTTTNTITIPAGSLTGLTTATISVQVNSGNCMTTASFILYVNRVDAGTISGTQTICPGNIPAPLTSIRAATSSLTGELPGSISYQWEQSSDGGISYTTILGATSSSLSLSSQLTNTARYRRVAFSTIFGKACGITSQEVTIVVSSELCEDDTQTSSSTSSSTVAESYTINVTASSSSDYTLIGTDRNGSVSGNDPNLTFNIGDTVNFAVNASGHPFYLKLYPGANLYNLLFSGVFGNGATNGTVSWTPTSSRTYYYQCLNHNGMYGTITVNE